MIAKKDLKRKGIKVHFDFTLEDVYINVSGNKTKKEKERPLIVSNVLRRLKTGFQKG